MGWFNHHVGMSLVDEIPFPLGVAFEINSQRGFQKPKDVGLFQFQMS